jgi:hypothetical protein
MKQFEYKGIITQRMTNQLIISVVLFVLCTYIENPKTIVIYQGFSIREWSPSNTLYFWNHLKLVAEIFENRCTSISNRI